MQEYYDIVITGISYTNSHDSPIIIISGRTQDRKKVFIRVTGFKPYFYTSRDPSAVLAEHPEIRNRIISHGPGFETILSTHVYKVTVKIPEDVSRLRKHFWKTWEDDVLFEWRFLVDTGIKHSIRIPKKSVIDYTEIEAIDDLDLPSNMRIQYLDDEYDNRKFRGSIKMMIQKASVPFICAVMYDDYLKRYEVFLYYPGHKGKKKIKWTSQIPDKEKQKITYGHLDKISVNINIYPTEEEALSAYNRCLHKTSPDIIFAWNLDGFDIPIRINRSKNINVPYDLMSPIFHISTKVVGDKFKKKSKKDKAQKLIYDIKHLAAMDALTFYKTITVPEGKKKSYQLDYIGLIEIAMGKIKMPLSIGEMWEKKIFDLVKYNIRDVEVMMAIIKLRDMVGYFDSLRREAGMPIQMTQWGTKIWDMFLLRMAHGVHVLKSKYTEKVKVVTVEKKKDEDVEGASVIKPYKLSKGAMKNIIMLDLKTLYPMIMMILNICMSTKDPNGDIIAANGVRFTSKFDGYIRRLLQNFTQKRDVYKDLRDLQEYDSIQWKLYENYQKAMKTATNTAYGALLNKGFRLMDKEIGAAIPASGQIVLKFIAMIANKGDKALETLKDLSFDSINHWYDWYNLNRSEDNGTPVVYGDTDSIFVKLDDELPEEECIAEGQRLAKEINNSFDMLLPVFNIKEQNFDVKLEKYYSSFFIEEDKKKVYAGYERWKEGKWFDHPGKFAISGYGAKRSDTSEFGSDIQKFVLKAVCDFKPLTYIAKYLRYKKKQMRDLPLELMCPPSGVNTFTSEDKKTGEKKVRNHPYVRGIMYSNANFGTQFQEGDKVRVLYLTRTPVNYPHTKEVCFQDIDQIPKEFLQYADYDKIIELNMENKVKDILANLGTSIYTLLSGKKQKSLF